MTRAVRWLPFWAALAVALAFRLVSLDLRPLHHDEGVNASFLLALAQGRPYAYNPASYHGPFLYYAGLWPLRWLGAGDGALRLPVALASALMIPLLLPLRRRLGTVGVTAAAWLLAVSPFFVYYGRDLIHETWLAVLTLALVAAGSLYLESRRIGHLLLAATCLGLLFTVKETALLTTAGLVAAAVLTGIRTSGRWWPEDLRGCLESVVFQPRRGAGIKPGVSTPGSAPRSSPEPRRGAGRLVRSVGCLRPFGAFRGCGDSLPGVETPGFMPTPLWGSQKRLSRHPLQVDRRTLGLMVLCAAVPYVLLFTSFLTHPRGLIDSFWAFLLWTGKGAQGSGHAKPWFYFLKWLLRDEPALLAGGLLGSGLALRRRDPSGSFCALWFLSQLVIYSAIPYKTPWLALNILLPAALTTGYLVREIWDRPSRPARAGLLALLLLGLGWSGWRAAEVTFRGYDDPRLELPYAQTRREAMGIMTLVREVAKRAPAGRGLTLHALLPYRWPIPWYLRDFPNARYWKHFQDIPLDFDADVLLVDLREEGKLRPRLKGILPPKRLPPAPHGAGGGAHQRACDPGCPASRLRARPPSAAV